MATSGIPWRGPGAGRPDLPLPPGPMPLWRDGGLRKRWRYVGFYGEALMLCAARAEVGPLGQSFWVLWDRERGRELAHTALRPGSREVVLDGPRLLIDAPGVHADLHLGEATPIESICPSGAGWGWTRKRAGVPMTGHVEVPGRRIPLDGFGVDDESAGYQARRTSWHWSAGVGTAADGRALAWNLVEGINDPPEHSERAVWVDGVPHEPAPVSFDGLDAVRFAEASRLDFTPGAERARDDNFLLVRSTYRHRFGTFTGRLDGIDLAEGRGVMESHDALW
ncbi:MAG TPA: DUF2804 family protein [Solirubrobacterales bacterium]|jgi:hypothetical protein|nr:DUF2804 family protein [Solirubrobacterales bacterium]